MYLIEFGLPAIEVEMAGINTKMSVATNVQLLGHTVGVVVTVFLNIKCYLLKAFTFQKVFVALW